MEKMKQEASHSSAVLIRVKLKNGNGNGSGFFIKKDLIATNIHVVALATSVSVELVDCKTETTIKEFDIVGVRAFDAKNDLVILKIDGKDSPLPLGNSDLVKTRDTVQAEGFPNGKYSVTKAPIHSIRASDKWIRMKASTCGGISGGPVLNCKNEVIGIAVRNVCFFSYVIPINAAKMLLNLSQVMEPLNQWQKREQIRAYTYMVQSQIKNTNGCFDDIIADLDKAVQLYPDFALCHYKRGTAKSEFGKSKLKRYCVSDAQQHYRDAIDDYTDAIRLCSDFVEAYNDRADAKYNLGNFEKTFGNVEAALNLYHAANIDANNAVLLVPKFDLSYHTRGQIKYVLGDICGAIQDYEKVRELNPDYTDVLSDLKLAQETKRQQTKATGP